VPRTRRSTAPHDEVEGYLAGMAHALEARRRSGTPDPRGEAELRSARRALAEGAPDRAAALLEAIDERLRAAEGEPELSEIPRDLVGYTPRGDRGRALAPDEEPLAHRRLLILRLVEVTQLPATERERALQELGAAERALAAGDRSTARRAIDAAHRRLERSGSPRTVGAPPPL
jgi:hypothetical protein